MSKRIRTVLCMILIFSVVLPQSPAARAEESAFIKWVDFDVPYCALDKALEMDIQYHDTDTPVDWVEVLAYLAAKNGGDFTNYKNADVVEVVGKLTAGSTMAELTEGLKSYAYFHEAYSAVLDAFVGDHSVEVQNPDDPEKKAWETRYGLKNYSPIAAGFYYDHYNDFGAGRSYGYARKHLGHDMFGQTGTPIIAIESGTVEVLGWNQYGGWRIGIRSFDGRRYYYYAHLRQNRPYHCDLQEGQTVKAGDVIGYMGRTGYSTSENVNNIQETHLHWGLQLIFDASQKEGNGEIWVDVYALTQLLEKHRSETYRVAETKEFYRQNDFTEPEPLGD